MLIPNFNSGRVKKIQMIQLVNKQIHKLKFGKKFHKKEKTKNIRIVWKQSTNIVMSSKKKKKKKRKKTLTEDQVKRKKHSILSRANIIINT